MALSQTDGAPAHSPLVVRDAPPADLLIRRAHVHDPRAGIDARHDVLVRGGELDQPAVEDDDVEGAVEPLARVEDVDAAHDQARGCGGRAHERHAGAGSGSGWPTRAGGCAVITS